MLPKLKRFPSVMLRSYSLDPAEREYFKNITKYQLTFTSLMRAALDDHIPNLRQIAKDDLPRLDAIAVPHFDKSIPKAIERLFAKVQKQLQDQIPDKVLTKWAQAMVVHTNDINKKNTARMAKAADLDIEPLMKDGKMTKFFQNIVQENVSLIKSISTRKLPAVKNALVAMITADKSVVEIHEYIHKTFKPDPLSQGTSFAQARLIARDQVNKLNGKINEYRQQQLGATHYVWETSHDERVRPDHKALDGSKQAWAKPPITNKRTKSRNHPGFDFQCRCNALIYIDNIID